MGRTALKLGLVAVLATTGFCASQNGARGAAVSAPQKGAFALFGATPHLRSMLTSRSASSTSGTTVDIVQYRIGSNVPVTAYDRDMTKFMHLVIVSDDFREFAHLHPTLSAGHFSIPVALSSGHRYYVYADSIPSGIGQQVFRFSLQAGRPPKTLHTAVAASPPNASVGPYGVRLSTTRLHTGAHILTVSITKNGASAKDLRPFLGAIAHAVLINTADLTYIHLHALSNATAGTTRHIGSMGSMATNSPKRVSPNFMLEVPPLGRHAAYKLWLQFQGGSTVYTAPFTLVSTR